MKWLSIRDIEFGIKRKLYELQHHADGKTLNSMNCSIMLMEKLLFTMLRQSNMLDIWIIKQIILNKMKITSHNQMNTIICLVTLKTKIMDIAFFSNKLTFSKYGNKMDENM